MVWFIVGAALGCAQLTYRLIARPATSTIQCRATP